MIFKDLAVGVIDVNLRKHSALAEPSVTHMNGYAVLAGAQEFFYGIGYVTNSSRIIRLRGREFSVVDLFAVDKQFVIAESDEINSRSRNIFFADKKLFSDDEAVRVKLCVRTDPCAVPLRFIGDAEFEKTFSAFGFAVLVTHFEIHVHPLSGFQLFSAIFRAHAFFGKNPAAIPQNFLRESVLSDYRIVFLLFIVHPRKTGR